MSCPEPTDCAERDPIPTTDENAKTERAVLAFVLDEHPNRLTIPEVSLAMNAKQELSSFLRRQNVTVRVMRNAELLVDGIASGALDGGISEELLAGGLAAENDWWVAPLPDDLVRYNLVIGLWKGDLTLKRKVVEAFENMEENGTLSAILARYGASALQRDSQGS